MGALFAASSFGIGIWKSPSTATASILLLLLLLVSCQQVSSSSSSSSPMGAPPVDHQSHIYLVGEYAWEGIHNFGYTFRGWTPVDYQRWADSKVFHVGDVLRFYYAGALEPDCVIQVTQENFESCNQASPLATYTSGDDYITLEKEGDFYFISGGIDHCLTAKQKVHIKVVARGHELASSISEEAATPSPAGYEASPISEAATPSPASYDHTPTTTTMSSSSSASSTTSASRMSTWIFIVLGVLAVVLSVI